MRVFVKWVSFGESEIFFVSAKFEFSYGVNMILFGACNNF